MWKIESNLWLNVRIEIASASKWNICVFGDCAEHFRSTIKFNLKASNVFNAIVRLTVVVSDVESFLSSSLSLIFPCYCRNKREISPMETFRKIPLSLNQSFIGWCKDIQKIYSHSCIMFQLKYFPSVFAHIHKKRERERNVCERAYVCLCILKIVSVRRFVANENKYGLFQGMNICKDGAYCTYHGLHIVIVGRVKSHSLLVITSKQARIQIVKWKLFEFN